QVLLLMLVAVGATVTLVGALGLLSTVTMNVIERRREIAVMRANGASTATVVAVFVTESVLIGLGGWCIADGAGIFGAPALGAVISSSRLPMEVPYTIIGMAVALIITLGVGVVSAIAPSMQAGRARIGEILRYS